MQPRVYVKLAPLTISNEATSRQAHERFEERPFPITDFPTPKVVAFCRIVGAAAAAALILASFSRNPPCAAIQVLRVRL